MTTYVDWYAGARRQDWRTPGDLFRSLDAEYHFDLDGASNDENRLAEEGSTPDSPVSWVGRRVFCNPPWSNIPPFIERATEAELAVLLVPARTNGTWFHRALALGAEVRYFQPRPRFSGAKANSPVDCVLLVFRGGDGRRQVEAGL